MTPIMQRGFDDAKAGGIDPILGTADTAKAKEYRDGHRQARRDAFDGIELEGEPAPVYFAHPNRVEEAKAVLGESVAVVATEPIAIESTPYSAGEPRPFAIWQERIAGLAPEPPKKRKPKPAPADDQLSLL